MSGGIDPSTGARIRLEAEVTEVLEGRREKPSLVRSLPLRELAMILGAMALLLFIVFGLLEVL